MIADAIKEAPARIVRGFQRTVGLSNATSEEYKTEGDTALFAIAQDTPEGDIQAATQRAAWMAQVQRLEDVEALGGKRTHAQELLLAQLRRNVRQVDAAQAARHATPQGLGPQRLAAFGAVGRPQGLLGAVPALTWFQPWMIWPAALAAVLAWGGFQSARLHHAKADLTETRADLAAQVRENQALTIERNILKEAASQADQNAAQTAESLRRLEAARQREAARARRDQTDIGNILSGVGDPPDVGLREPERSDTDPAN